ncbi:pyridoxal phosphate-dependent transferase [Corynascus similis CBS 632.67]
MARSDILARLSRRQQERRTTASNRDVKQVTQDASWRRKSLVSIRRRLSPNFRSMSPSPEPEPDAPHGSPVVVTDVVSLNHGSGGGNSNNVNDNNNNDRDIKIPSLYSKSVELIRQEEYPHMNQGTYLDHGGATVPALATLHRTTALLSRDLYGNPHSANRPAARSTAAIETVRSAALAFLGADPAHFDLVFTANATAAIKLVGDAFRDIGEDNGNGASGGGFWYGYHREAHTSLVGVRELVGPAGAHHCFVAGDDEVEAWLDGKIEVRGDNCGAAPGSGSRSRLSLMAWPGQSNLTGRRLPTARWAGRVRENGRRRGVAAAAWRDTYTLLDAAALAMTSGLGGVFADPEAAPDFVCVSFYKIFGFPDLGGLVVRKDSGHILTLRKYFGGGTVSMVSAVGAAWHVSKGSNVGTGGATGEGHGGALHEALEDGTLPFHSILALGEAIDVHTELYGSMRNISAYTTALMKRMYRGMRALRYGNGQPLCKVYEEDSKGSGFGDAQRQGSTVAFNVFRADGCYEPYDVVESLANDRRIYVRSGGICCPGGMFTALQYEPWQLRRARSAGHHCGAGGIGLINELPTGVVRASLGAMSTVEDVDRFLGFLRETFIAREDSAYASSNEDGSLRHSED